MENAISIRYSFGFPTCQWAKLPPVNCSGPFSDKNNEIAVISHPSLNMLTKTFMRFAHIGAFELTDGVQSFYGNSSEIPS